MCLKHTYLLLKHICIDVHIVCHNGHSSVCYKYYKLSMWRNQLGWYITRTPTTTPYSVFFHLQSALNTSIIVKCTFKSDPIDNDSDASYMSINLETYLLPSLLPAAAGAFLQDFTLIFTLLLFPPGPRYVLWDGHSHFTLVCCFDGSFKTN